MYSLDNFHSSSAHPDKITWKLVYYLQFICRIIYIYMYVYLNLYKGNTRTFHV